MGEQINGDPTELPWQTKPSQTPLSWGRKKQRAVGGCRATPQHTTTPLPAPGRGSAPRGQPPPRPPCSAGVASRGPRGLTAQQRRAYTERLLCARPQVSSSGCGNTGKRFSSAPECLLAKELSNPTARTISFKPCGKPVRVGAQTPQNTEPV